MRIPSILIRSALALAAALALAGPAPAGAQRLATTIGDPVEYRVDLPPEWDTEEEDGTLMAVSKDQDFAILIVAMDILADQEDPLPMSEADQRRFYTTMLMASDSLLLNLIGPLMRHQSDMPLTDVEQELGTLGGERAAVLFARTEVDGGSAGSIRKLWTPEATSRRTSIGRAPAYTPPSWGITPRRGISAARSRRGSRDCSTCRPTTRPPRSARP